MLYRVVSWLFVKICDLWSCLKSAFIFIHLLQCSSYVFTGSPDACRNYQCVSGIYVLQPRPGAHWTKILIEAWSLWYLFTVFYIFSTIGCVVMSLFYLALIRSQLTSTRKNTMRPCFCWSTHFWSMKSLSYFVIATFLWDKHTDCKAMVLNVVSLSCPQTPTDTQNDSTWVGSRPHLDTHQTWRPMPKLWLKHSETSCSD